MNDRAKVEYSARQISTRIARLGRQISRDFRNRRIDVVAVLDSALIFASDLVRQITVPTVCHFVRAEMRDVHLGGHSRREIFFTYDPDLRGRDLLVVDAVLHSGVTLDFLVKRLQVSHPNSIRVAVLIDKPKDRKVDLKPDYAGFSSASKFLVGYGLPGSDGLNRNLPYIGSFAKGGGRKTGKPPSKTRRAAARRMR